ncbi:MAG: aminoacyl-tRNA hydrolase [Deltaproteobacteria bacterium]|nr:aminoacyl-tRNA hydrolase [Deltaproteobacteria bacterium]
MGDALAVTSRLKLPAEELSWTAVRASGPGGQNVNKVSSKVELRFDVRGSRVLDGPTKARLLAIARRRIDARGVLLVTCQVTRDQRRNLELARQRLAELVRRALQRPRSRRPTKPTPGSQQRRLAAKRKRGEHKRRRAQPVDAEG